GSQRTGGYRAARRRHKQRIGREAGGDHRHSGSRAEFRDMAAIAKARTANTINECAREILVARRGNRKQHRNAAAVSARGYRANLIRDRETSVSASRTAGSSL